MQIKGLAREHKLKARRERMALDGASVRRVQLALIDRQQQRRKREKERAYA